MDSSCIVLTCLLFIQMAFILIMLNPLYDVRKITQYTNKIVKSHKSCCIFAGLIYFGSVLYLGMYLPLQNIMYLIFGKVSSEYDKLLLLSRIEKNYIVAGFSLFLVVVLYGLKSLVSYTACLMELSDRQSENFPNPSESKFKKPVMSNSSILPNLLKVKRSISYETILFTKELREQLKAMLRNVEVSETRCTLSNILENTGTRTELGEMKE